MDIIYLIKDLIKEKNLQKFVNNRFYDKNKFVLNKRIFTKIGTPDGNIFYSDMDAIEINYAYTDYDISNIDKNTNVLVIGANVGGFSLRVARKAKHVYAVEPVMTEQLKRNIALNNLNNITVIEHGLGKHSIQKIMWHNHEKEIEIRTMHDILKMCNNTIDYLKMDCEGCEYSILKKDLDSIQEISAELHNFDGTTPFHIFTDLLKECGFAITIKETLKYTSLIHAYRKIS